MYIHTVYVYSTGTVFSGVNIYIHTVYVYSTGTVFSWDPNLWLIGRCCCPFED